MQTGKSLRQDLTATVTASGEIKPKNYINLGANTLGPAPITEILVKEGDHVKKGQVVAKLESVQANADVVAQKAAIDTALADSAAAEAGMKSMAGRRPDRASHAGAEQGRTRAHQAQYRPRHRTVQSQAARQAGLRSEESRVRHRGRGHRRSRGAAGAGQVAGERKPGSNWLRPRSGSRKLQANLTRYTDVLEKYYVTRAARRHRDQSSGARWAKPWFPASRIRRPAPS